MNCPQKIVCCNYEYIILSMSKACEMEPDILKDIFGGVAFIYAMMGFVRLRIKTKA